MGANRNGLLALLTAAAFVASGLIAASAEAPGSAAPPSLVDYDGFIELAERVAPLRAQRLVDLAAFKRMAAEPGTLILDTRTRDAFAAGHIEGAVNLPFSDFTQESLAEAIPSKATRILIYCNNNFADDAAPVMVKKVELALNVPTFVNLVGYGYEDVYELADLVSMSDPQVGWTASDAAL